MTVPRRTIFLALFPFACGYFLSYLLRAVNAVVAPDLVQDFAVSPAELGLLTSAYLLSFSLFQLPLGVFLDRYGARRVQTILLGIAAGGCFLFAAAPDFLSLVGARAIIGLGFSAGLMDVQRTRLPPSISLQSKRSALPASARVGIDCIDTVNDFLNFM